MNMRDFVARVQHSSDLPNPKEAERWSVAVLTSLNHLLPDSETRRHFVSQLPGRLKSRVRDDPPRSLLLNCDAFLQHLGSALGTHAPRAESALRAVYGVLKQAVSEGEIANLEAHMPKEVATLLQREASSTRR